MDNSINPYLINTDQIKKYAKLSDSNSHIDPSLYEKYDVKRGLRDMRNNTGVLAGLTEIGEVHGYSMIDYMKTPSAGKLYYRGVNINHFVNGFISENRFGFEECIYLLLFGELPTKSELEEFKELLAFYRCLPKNFVRDVILKAPATEVMNTLMRGVLALYPYDDKADDTSKDNLMRQCIQLIARFPLLSVYGYQAYNYYHNRQSLFIHTPNPELSMAEDLLSIMRPDQSYTPLEAKLLDMCLVVHAEHGGGNNSTFTDHVVASTGTDTYSVMAAALGSLKGPKHGGANIKVEKMFANIKANVKDWGSDDEVTNYLRKIANKEAFDGSGLIYGIGHAVYTLSDPRCVILKSYVRELAEEKGRLDEFELYDKVESLAPDVLREKLKSDKPLCANVDFYSGFLYNLLGIPEELFTPLFAISRISGWSAHRMEEMYSNKIIRPAFKNVHEHVDYTPIDERE
ncbi:MAG: citrate/2-methylcitrate synthase [Lachnospiraceae bacterium]|nr:citrate/2-methylcitrate synthase [Lachnospiraceae bacterium]